VFHTAIDMMEIIRQLVAEGWQVTAVEAGLAAAGVILTQRPQVIGQRPVTPKTGDPSAGMLIDEDSGMLIVDTWAPDWGDVEVTFWAREAGRMTAAIAVYDETGDRREKAAIVNRVLVRRAAGSPLSSQTDDSR
jgi:hypothetical protein